MKPRLILFFAMLCACSQAQAWIGYGFKSGMSRYVVESHLADNGLSLVSAAERETLAGPDPGEIRYRMLYCSTPQVLYRMLYRLADTHEEFVATRHKFERRYGTPEGVDAGSSENWRNADVSLIWHISDSETILLQHDRSGTVAEFQDVSVCQ